MGNINSDIANLISGKMFGYGILGLIYCRGYPYRLGSWGFSLTITRFSMNHRAATFIGEYFFVEKVVCNRMLLFVVFYHILIRCFFSSGALSAMAQGVLRPPGSPVPIPKPAKPILPRERTAMDKVCFLLFALFSCGC